MALMIPSFLSSQLLQGSTELVGGEALFLPSYQQSIFYFFPRNAEILLSQEREGLAFKNEAVP